MTSAGPVAPNSAPAHSDAAHRPHRAVSDSRGRVHRGGESDRDVLGHSRGFMVYLPWIAMTSAASALLRRDTTGAGGGTPSRGRPADFAVARS